MTDAAPESEKATLHFPGGSAEFPVIRGTDGHDSIDISTFIEILNRLKTKDRQTDHRLQRYARSNVNLDTGVNHQYMELFKRSIELDAVINQVTISEERKKKYDFSEPYTVSGIQALVLKKNEAKLNIKSAADLAGKKVGVGLGTNYEQWVKANVPTADIRTYEDDPTKFQDLRIGRIDAILIDRLAALEYAKKAPDTVAAGDAFSRQEAGIALRKGEPELLSALNKALDKLRADGTLKKLSEKYFNADVTQ